MCDNLTQFLSKVPGRHNGWFNFLERIPYMTSIFRWQIPKALKDAIRKFSNVKRRSYQEDSDS